MPSAVNPEEHDAVLFDLDGVLTTTRSVHATAWKETMDEFLRRWDAAHGTTTERFDDPSDYAAHVDGKPLQDGVRAFLAWRHHAGAWPVGYRFSYGDRCWISRSRRTAPPIPCAEGDR